ncbi:hypothetical protein KI387_004799 [Taxus chinensis]|uniref:Uncharacterized protein n=1 Tax=Taxus chinensis TaxID=29808 RepID=A0AA38LI56_TAXCH|nr:hypothetical protein KI387_004799 [Taxus chinensis]
MEAAVEIRRLNRKSTVFPSRPSQRQQCKLCSSDLMMLSCNYIQRCLLFSMENTCYDFQSVVELLKKSLSQTLLYFYPLAGRLAISAEGVVYIDCNDRGADFIEAVAAPETCLAHVMTEEVGAVVRDLFALNGAINMDGRFLPLLTVQATKLKDGLAVAFTVNHAVIDGTSLWHFINSWAQLCQQSSLTANISQPPLHTRCFGTPSPINLNLHEYFQKPRIMHEFSPPQLREKMFHFPVETLSRLKEEANRAAFNDGTISSFQALCAHIWVAITRARRLSPAEETTFKLPVNCRPRMVPPLPSSYFGNAIQMVGATVTAGELLEEGMGRAAGILHRIIAAHKDANIRAELEKPPTVIEIDKYIPQNCVSMGSSPRFPMYDNDFGWGRPVGARSGLANKFDGKMSAYPGREGTQSMDIEICLLPHTMSVLESDPHFLVLHG